MNIKAITGNYMLIEVIERSIHEPKFFETYQEAFHEMAARMAQAMDMDVLDLLDKYYDADDSDAGISENVAFCESRNHNNCDWRICEVV